MKPKLGQSLFYTAPTDSGIKPGPYPCVVTQVAPEGCTITAFGAGRAAAQVFEVQDKELSEDGNPYVAPAKAPPGVAPVERKTKPVAKSAKKAK